jgi:hypothetical protein
MEYTSFQKMLPDLLDPETTEGTKQRLREFLITLIQESNRQAITRDLAITWEQIKYARAIGDEPSREAAADRFEELMLQRANLSMVRTRVAEMVLRTVTAAAIEALREQFCAMGQNDILPEIEARISDRLQQIFTQLNEQSTLGPPADQISSVVS